MTIVDTSLLFDGRIYTRSIMGCVVVLQPISFAQFLSRELLDLLDVNQQLAHQSLTYMRSNRWLKAIDILDGLGWLVKVFELMKQNTIAQQKGLTKLKIKILLKYLQTAKYLNDRASAEQFVYHIIQSSGLVFYLNSLLEPKNKDKVLDLTHHHSLIGLYAHIHNQGLRQINCIDITPANILQVCTYSQIVFFRRSMSIDYYNASLRSGMLSSDGHESIRREIDGLLSLHCQGSSLQADVWREFLKNKYDDPYCEAAKAEIEDYYNQAVKNKKDISIARARLERYTADRESAMGDQG